MNKTLNPTHCHFFKGTIGQMTTHTKETVWVDDILIVGSHKLKVTEIVNKEKSKYLIVSGLKQNYYELKFEVAK